MNDYPKCLYDANGDTMIVSDESEEKAAKDYMDCETFYATEEKAKKRNKKVEE